MRRNVLGAAVGLLVVGGILLFYLFRPPQPAHQGSRAIIIRLESFALNINPAALTDIESRKVATLLHAGLIAVEQGGGIRPLVANKVEDKGIIKRFSLRPGITFNNGQPITTELVAASICRNLQPTSLYAWSLKSIKHTTATDQKSVICDGIRTPETNVIEIEEDVAAPWLLDALAGPAGWITPAIDKPGEFGDVPGAGPYRVTEILSGTKVVLAPRSGGPISPGNSRVELIHIADEDRAIQSFKAGQLDIIELSTPKLIRELGQLTNPKTAYLAGAADRLRVVIVGEPTLAKKGFSQDQVREFKRRLSAVVDRKAIASDSGGLGAPSLLPFIASNDPLPLGPVRSAQLPATTLTVITEGDPYSDLIASRVAQTIGDTTLTYRGVEKGLLVQSIVKNEFDLASVVIEATTHAPLFWTSFFTPGSPFTAFGKPLPALANLDIRNAAHERDAFRTISSEGNWIGLLRERKVVAVRDGITGPFLTPSGQVSYAWTRRQ